MTPGDQALLLLAGRVSPGPPFFQVAAQALAIRAGCRWAGVGQLCEAGDSVDLLAFWDGDHQVEPFSFPLEGSPCKAVYRSDPEDPHRFFPSDVAEHFSGFPMLAQIGARSYRGEVFHDSAERPVGHVFVISEDDEEDDPGIREFFRLVAQRVGAEYNRWRAEEALASSTRTLRWYESMVATTSDRMALIDTTYTYRAINSSYLESAPFRPHPRGRPWAREDVVGHTIVEVLDPSFARDVVQPHLERCFAGNDLSFEGWVEGPGEQRRYLQRNYRPFRAHGNIEGAVLTIRDLTRRQRQITSITELAVHDTVTSGDLHEAAKRITEQAADCLDIARAGIWQRTSERRTLRCLAFFDRSTRTHSSGAPLRLDDSSEVFGILASGQPVIEHDTRSGSRARASNEADITSRIEMPIQVSGELVGVARFEHLGTPRIWQADEIKFASEAAFLMVQTITRRDRRMMDRLEAKNAELEARSTEMESFTYAVSHDLKSPLFTIKGFLGRLAKDIKEGHLDRIENHIGRIQNATGTMQQLLDELLELSQIGRLVLTPQEIPLSDLSRETLQLLGGKIAERGVRVDISPDLPVVFGDRLRLMQMLQNLIENAIKFMGDQPEPLIEIASREENGETVCYVRDNGQGIAAPYREKIFGLFERLDPAGEGTGIGLTIVARIVEIHGGRIWVESAGAERGSSFCFVLPGKT